MKRKIEPPPSMGPASFALVIALEAYAIGLGADALEAAETAAYVTAKHDGQDFNSSLYSALHEDMFARLRERKVIR